MTMRSTAADAVKCIKSGDRVFVHGVAAAPLQLIDAMTARADELRDVEIVHLHTEGTAPYTRPELEDSFRVNAFFVGANVRKAVQEGRGDYIPVFLSEIPALFRKGVLPIDVALIHVSPPPMIFPASSFLLSIIESMCSSSVPVQTNLCTCTFRVWPIRNARSVA